MSSSLLVRDWSSLSAQQIADLKHRLSPPVFTDSSHRFLIRTLRSSENECERVRQLFVTGQCEYHMGNVDYIEDQFAHDMKDPYAEYVQQPGSNYWVVERVEDGALVGCVAVHPVSKGDHFYYLQYVKKTLPIPPNHSTYSSTTNSAAPTVTIDPRVIEHPDIFDVVGSESELRRMVVDPSCRGLNIAQRLLDVLIDFSHACGYVAVHLSTLYEMFPACRLYSGYGFETGHTEAIHLDRKNLRWEIIRQYFPEYKFISGRFEQLVAEWENQRKEMAASAKSSTAAASKLLANEKSTASSSSSASSAVSCPSSAYSSSSHNLYAQMASPPHLFSLIHPSCRPRTAKSVIHPVVPEDVAKDEQLYPPNLPALPVKVQHFRFAIV